MSSSPEDHTPSRIVVVDPNPAVGRVLGQLLEACGAEVEVYASAEDALTGLGFRPAVLITDLALGGEAVLLTTARYLAGCPGVQILHICQGSPPPTFYPCLSKPFSLAVLRTATGLTHG